MGNLSVLVVGAAMRAPFVKRAQEAGHLPDRHRRRVPQGQLPGPGRSTAPSATPGSAGGASISRPTTTCPTSLSMPRSPAPGQSGTGRGGHRGRSEGTVPEAVGAAVTAARRAAGLRSNPSRPACPLGRQTCHQRTIRRTGRWSSSPRTSLKCVADQQSSMARSRRVSPCCSASASASRRREGTSPW